MARSLWMPLVSRWFRLCSCFSALLVETPTCIPVSDVAFARPPVTLVIPVKYASSPLEPDPDPDPQIASPATNPITRLKSDIVFLCIDDDVCKFLN